METHNIDQAFYISELLRKQVQQLPLTEDEQSVLDAWLLKNGDRKDLVANLKDHQFLSHRILQLQLITDPQKQLRIVRSRLGRKKIMRLARRWAVAASVIIGLFIWIYVQQHSSSPETLKSALGDDAAPGSFRATIELSTGEKIELNTTSKGILNTQEGIKYTDGTTLHAVEEVQWASLKTPRAGHYKVVLPDGSTVYLNAESTLTYPTKFDKKQRKVELRGEAYFDVKSMPYQPFIVETNQQEIVVLGTQFNVRSYTKQEKTSLVHGKVNVLTKDHQSLTLFPGEQAIAQGTALNKRTVDIEEQIAWMNGQLAGSSVSLQQIVGDLERWYDVNFLFQADYKNNERAYININRNEKLSTVLEALGKIYKLHFKIIGKEVFVKSN